MSNPLSDLIVSIETWGAGALAGIEKLGIGIIAKFTSDQFSAITDAATAYKEAKLAGKSDADCWNAAYVVLGKDEAAAISNAELGLADAIIEIMGTPPALPSQ
ncbi:MAG TPA: hypothetical protein VG867_02950 [Rhizomicrobium sp.]|nr:hypothetical protein [Rhizomicrobium sp.]